MNTLKKLVVAVAFSAFTLTGVAAPAKAAEVFGVDVSAAASEISARIAAELSAQFKAALSAPRAKKVRQPSVVVTEGVAVVVEATRLPALDGDEQMRTAQLSETTSSDVRF